MSLNYSIDINGRINKPGKIWRGYRIWVWVPWQQKWVIYSGPNGWNLGQVLFRNEADKICTCVEYVYE